MKLLDKLEALFVNQPERKKNEHPSLFDRLRNVFFAAEFLKKDLQGIPPFCRCEDAISHLEGRCSCTKRPAGSQAEEVSAKGCLAHLETLRLDVRSLRQSLQRHRNELRPEEKTEEVRRELSLIENFAENMGSIVEEIRNHASEWELSCSNDALQRLKESSSELEKYSTEFFWSLLKQDRGEQINSSSKVKRVS
ncbi:MAG TPA: hypothetical protein VJT71_01485 [Pyrinomonadaceae bacterium]|jgi:hypothetical protein|nr:hypothetical protein [Pyrinomonadaceae bacterium]